MTHKHAEDFRKILDSDVPIRSALQDPDARLAEGDKLSELLAPLVATFLTTFHIKGELEVKFVVAMAAKTLVFHGLMTHCLLFHSDYRLRFDDRMDRKALLTKWLTNSLQSWSTFRSYDSHNHKIPTAIFNSVFNKLVEPIQKSMGFGWWRRSQNRSRFLELFADGIVLGLTYDLTSKELSELEA